MSHVINRPPVVVVLGHVDHGKTTLLDYIRKTKHAQKEIGGITQRIGAYEVDVAITGYVVSKITFIDTPGHEAFSTLRARGAWAADIAVLVVDAKDSVMPQTIEAISHIQSAKIPAIVAINKIDLPGANPQQVKQDLVSHGVMIENMGGDIPVVLISAKKGTGVDDLLETILIVASEKKAVCSPDNPAEGIIIESQKDKQGIGVSVILRDGSVHIGDTVYVGSQNVKIKTLVTSSGAHLKSVSPSTPFLLYGFKTMPEVGSLITSKPQQLPEIIHTDAEKKPPMESSASIAALLSQKKADKKLKLIIKTNTQGSLDAIVNNLEKNENVEIALATLGDINKADIFLAKTTQAVVIGFSIDPDKHIVQLAEQEKVVIKTYDLIYELLKELTEVGALIHEKEKKAKQLKGEAKILAQFIIEKERVSGIKVTKGKLALNDELELYRDDRLIGKAKIVSLKTRAKPVKEIKKNEEAGVIFYPQLDFAIEDVIKSYSI